jgi:hypothetical protein
MNYSIGRKFTRCSDRALHGFARETGILNISIVKLLLDTKRIEFGN